MMKSHVTSLNDPQPQEWSGAAAIPWCQHQHCDTSTSIKSHVALLSDCLYFRNAMMPLTTLTLTPALAPDSYVTPISNHVELRNAMVMWMVLPALCGGATRSKKWSDTSKHSSEPLKCKGLIDSAVSIIWCWCEYCDPRTVLASRHHVTPKQLYGPQKCNGVTDGIVNIIWSQCQHWSLH